MSSSFNKGNLYNIDLSSLDNSGGGTGGGTGFTGPTGPTGPNSGFTGPTGPVGSGSSVPTYYLSVSQQGGSQSLTSMDNFQTLTLNTVDFGNCAANFNFSTSQFTFPAIGLYNISLHVRLSDNITNTGFASAYIGIGSNIQSGKQQGQFSVLGNTSIAGNPNKNSFFTSILLNVTAIGSTTVCEPGIWTVFTGSLTTNASFGASFTVQSLF
jgi:hypothetical protein